MNCAGGAHTGHFPTLDACTRSKIDEPIRYEHGRFIVFNDDDGVAPDFVGLGGL